MRNELNFDANSKRIDPMIEVSRIAHQMRTSGLDNFILLFRCIGTEEDRKRDKEGEVFMHRNMDFFEIDHVFGENGI